MTSASKRADVLVIGAGMAGIATAHYLQQFARQLAQDVKVIVLEGRPDRIGGRIWTDRDWPEAPIDLGASWVSHLTINPLGAVAKEHGIKLVDSNLFNVHLVQGDGKELSEPETKDAMFRFFGIYADVKFRAEERRERGKQDVDAGREFRRALRKLKLPKQQRRNVEYFVNMAVAEANGANLDELSLYEWDDHYVEIMLRATVVPEGYAKIAEALANDLDIRLNHVVSCIRHNDKDVVVETNHGEFRAAHAVVTLPHPVLASDTVEFSPCLPGWKRKAIRKVGIGISDKFWFLFENHWWESISDKDFLGRVDEKGEGRWSTWVNFHRYTGLPILMCFNRTEHALALETMTDDEVIDEALTVLRKAYGPSVPRPRMKRSKWHADPFARGTIPNIPVGSTTSVYNVLARPVGRLRFAGDSTIREFNGLVFGAFLSGVREAGQLLPLLYGR